jgi:hypothetical protein
MYLDGSRMLHERACAVNVSSDFYTFPGAGHVPYIGNNSYMDTTEWFVRDFLVNQLGCNETPLQLANAPLQQAILYPSNYCDGTPANETCIASIAELETTVDVSIYPNPSSGMVTINSKTDFFNEIKVIDVLGRTVFTSTQVTKQLMIDISYLLPGTYIVKFTSSAGNSGSKQLQVQ